jgi:cobalamin synthase
MNLERRPFITAPRFTPLVGAAVGAVGGAVYWGGAQLWPTSVAVVLAMAATTLVSAALSPDSPDPPAPWLGIVFAVLLKYDVLMALSAASLPYPLPPNLALGVIMIAGHAAGGALAVSVLKPVSPADLGIALATGFAPAVLIGIPGLFGLVTAILARIAFAAYVRRSRFGAAGLGAAGLRMTQPLSEICFYLGAAAAWPFI